MADRPQLDVGPVRVHVVSRARIPYDVDFFGEEGCHGMDWWPDRYGTTVTLLITEEGSAYVCPEKPGKGWRIAMVPSGEAVLFEGTWPAEADGTTWRADGFEAMRRVLECGIRERLEPAAIWMHSRLWRPAKGDAPARTTEGKDLHGERQRWEVTVRGERTYIERPGGSWTITPMDIIEWRDAPDCDLERPSACISTPRRIPDESLRSLVIFLSEPWEAAGEVDRGIQAEASAQAVRAWDRMREIEGFERACYDPAEAGGSPAGS